MAKYLKNVIIRTITDAEIDNFDKINRGLDFGFSVDPSLMWRVIITTTNYISSMSFTRTGAGFDTLAEEIRKGEHQITDLYIATVQSRSIYELAQRKLKVTPAIKGKGSVNYGIRKLQDLTEIVIDKARCPNVAREFLEYEIEKDKNGNFKAEFPDKNNHSIDAVRICFVYVY